MNDIAEPVLIQTFIPKVVVKVFDECVLRWLARLNKSEFHAMREVPLIQSPTVTSGVLSRFCRCVRDCMLTAKLAGRSASLGFARILMICSSEKSFFVGCPHVADEDITNIAVY